LSSSRTSWVLVLPIKAPLMTQNQQRRAHWTQVARAKSDTELLVTLAAKKAKLTGVDGPISVQIVWYAADARKRDVDSLAVLAKSCLDALKKREIIEDDHSGIVTDVQLGPIVISRDNPRIEIVVRQLEVGGSVQDG
jgi:Holliday junction resolvase RusA-like endonuclease